MIRYRLDELGWYQFEWLAQVLLKERLGIGVQSWGGHHDHGWDAFSRGPLRFPDREVPSAGSFVFQVKFVDGANAATARFSQPLLSAVRKEASRISERLADPAPLGDQWRRLAHYALITNAPLTSNLRLEVENVIRSVLPQCAIHSLGGQDVCDLLDMHPNARRGFPQLLGLRDLTVLIETAVRREIIERSRAAIDEAKDLLPVFVPVGAYQRAIDKVHRYHFAVLEGPPEMGKTAIARMIGMAQLLSQWETLECRVPDDFFGSYRSQDKQMFIADDAFGRTEYDPSRVAQWEQDLGKILSRLDRRHWLLWTSRKHLLERARRTMDLQGSAGRFPEPGEVVVDASFLTVAEKALILYRHAKAANLNQQVISLIGQNARLIVNQSAFTPERIRRFVKEDAPKLVGIRTDEAKGKQELRGLVQQAIQNPTKRMRRSYEALPPSHKWLLLALLDAGTSCDTNELAASFARFPAVRKEESFDRLLGDLTEGFLRLRRSSKRFYDNGHVAVKEITFVDWIHPSYRDLAIEQLALDAPLIEAFLQCASLNGIKLAISDTGGASGSRKFPLLRSPQNWQLLSARCAAIAEESETRSTLELLETLTSAEDVANVDARQHVGTVLTKVCKVLKTKWDSGAVFSANEYAAYCRASVAADELVPLPALDAAWRHALTRLVGSLDSTRLVLLENPAALDEWVTLLDAISRVSHDFSHESDFRKTTRKCYQCCESSSRRKCWRTSTTTSSWMPVQMEGL